MLIGLISDTHGLVRPQALAALKASDLIIHAGDIGRPEVLERLRDIAPTFAVRGNVDTQAWAAALPATEAVEARRQLIWVLHDIAQLDLDPSVGFAAVVYGHSHKPSIERRDGVLYVNPGSAGPRRLGLPVTVGRLRVNGNRLEPEIVELDV
ncbi:MAG TPA: metallophosphoesterase family protein [Hyphomicrobiaceae bacterium]|jgi:putative phosphoesterase|nr:metallophosphoesterase family protein [Hyphomicrobiaceae bacterium]